jgi:hypothetical protein
VQTEALRNLRTMRQVASSLEVAKRQKVRVTNMLAKPEDIPDSPEPKFDRNLAHTLARENRRAASYEASVEKSRQRLLKLRSNLADVIRRNKALMDLRYNIQEARSKPGKTEPSPAPKPKSKFREIELGY